MNKNTYEGIPLHRKKNEHLVKIKQTKIVLSKNLFKFFNNPTTAIGGMVDISEMFSSKNDILSNRAVSTVKHVLAFIFHK